MTTQDIHSVQIIKKRNNRRIEHLMIGVNLLQIKKNVDGINLFYLYVIQNEGTSQYFILDHDIKSV